MLALEDMLDWFQEQEKKLNDVVREKTIAAETAGTFFTTGNVRAGGSGFVTGFKIQLFVDTSLRRHKLDNRQEKDHLRQLRKERRSSLVCRIGLR